jgi:hypothetical protein
MSPLSNQQEPAAPRGVGLDGVSGRRIDRVRVATAEGLVEIGWGDRQELLDRLDGIACNEDLIDAFRDVGTSRPVELNPERRARLRGALGFWADDVGGTDKLPPGVGRLLEILTAELD